MRPVKQITIILLSLGALNRTHVTRNTAYNSERR